MALPHHSYTGESYTTLEIPMLKPTLNLTAQAAQCTIEKYAQHISTIHRAICIDSVLVGTVYKKWGRHCPGVSHNAAPQPSNIMLMPI